MGDRRTDFFDEPRVLVPDRVRKLRVPQRFAPYLVDDVKVGPADACPSDLHDNVGRTGDPRFGYVDDSERLVIVENPRGFHPLPSLADGPYRVASMPRQNVAFSSVLIRWRRAARRNSMSPPASIGWPFTAMTSVASASTASPNSRRRARWASTSSLCQPSTSPTLSAVTSSSVRPASSRN